MDMREKRIEELYALGLQFNGSEFFKDDFNVHHTELFLDEDKWNRMITKIKNEMERRANLAVEVEPVECMCLGEEEAYCNWYKCPKCGNSWVHGHAKYCSKCGVPVKPIHPTHTK